MFSFEEPCMTKRFDWNNSQDYFENFIKNAHLEIFYKNKKLATAIIEGI